MAPVEVNVCANEAEVVSSLAKLIESKASECINKNNYFRVGLSGNNYNFLIHKYTITYMCTFSDFRIHTALLLVYFY